ncbi:MliC family protein [Kalamiella sp. sgz302252]|uniref:MliC family protein n=1 Tax=Pantoea sp. sgz302252 TaxID=3341827 RepID=UPI0036D32F1B
MKKSFSLVVVLLLSGCLSHPPDQVKKLHYRCGTLPLTVLLDNGRQQINLILDGNPLTLKQQPAASGTRYANDQYVFWSKGDGAFIERNGKVIVDDCRLDKG